jgi:hypothetical protein
LQLIDWEFGQEAEQVLHSPISRGYTLWFIAPERAAQIIHEMGSPQGRTKDPKAPDATQPYTEAEERFAVASLLVWLLALRPVTDPVVNLTKTAFLKACRDHSTKQVEQIEALLQSTGVPTDLTRLVAANLSACPDDRPGLGTVSFHRRPGCALETSW